MHRLSLDSQFSMDDARLAQAQLIVCERTGSWAQALVRSLQIRPPLMKETRSLQECWDELAASPTALLFLELTKANAELLLSWLLRLEQVFPEAKPVIVAGRDLSSYDQTCREAGAIHFVTSPRQLTPVADLVKRYLAQNPAPLISLTDRILAELPWSEEVNDE